MTHFINITRPVDESLVVWPGRSPPEQRWEKRIADGDHCNASFWRMSAHTGTHMDAPLHFIEGGATIDQIPPDVFTGECAVIDLRSAAGLTMDETLADRYRGEMRLLIRTHHSDSGSDGTYEPHERLLTPAAASRLLDGGLVLIGTDRLSVDDSQGNAYALHALFLGAGCVILEGLLLSGVAVGRYSLVAAPLLLKGMDASPVRAWLTEATLPESLGPGQELRTPDV
jgi:arylformamidase